MDTADRIFELLDAAGMEQKVFAQTIGTTDKVVSKWRTSSLKSYSKYLPQIADALGTTVQYLLTGDDGQSKQAAAPKGSGLVEEFARIFMTLTPEKQNKIIAEMLRLQRDE